MKKSTQLLSLIALSAIGINPLLAQEKVQTIGSPNPKNKMEARHITPQPSVNRALCAVEMDCEDDDLITNVTVGTINNNSACSPNGYGDYRIMTTTIQAGTTTNVSVTVGSGWDEEHVGLWIDLNNDEEFSFDEFQYIGVGSGSTVNGSFFVPANAAPGVYTARFIAYAGGLDGTEGCGFGYADYGEYEDYSFQITAAAACTTVPSSITAVATSTAVCADTPIAFILDYSPEAAQMSYQLQSSTDGTNWTNVGTPFNNLLNAVVIESITQSAQYRVILTCAASNASVTSNSIDITFLPVEECYCKPVLDCTDNDNITSVEVVETGYLNSSACGTDGYTNYSSNPITGLTAGSTYTLKVGVGGGFGFESVSIWVDYDKNGVFDENEFLYLGTGSSSIVTNTITIPSNVANGNYTMRVRVAATDTSGVRAGYACDEDQTYGETEDYRLVIGTGPVVGVDKQELNNISIFPNPTNGSIQITGIDATSVVTLIDVTGRTIETLEVNAGVSPIINLEKYSAGTYSVSIANENGSIVKRVIRN